MVSVALIKDFGKKKKEAVALGEDLAAQLDTIKAGSEPQEPPTPEADVDSGRDLKDLSVKLDTAITARDESAIRTITAEAQQIIQRGRQGVEENLVYAQDEYDAALREFGGEADETKRCAEVVAKKNAEFPGQQEYFKEWERYFDAEELIADLHEEQAPVAAEAPTGQERLKILEERLEILRKAKKAYEQRLAELDSEESSVADQIIAERKAAAINAQKAKIGVV